MKHKKTLFNVMMVVLLAVFVIIIIFSNENVNQIWQAIQSADYGYLMLAFAMLGVYIILYSISLIVITRSIKEKVKIANLFCISSSEFFFNGVTPFSMGGQPLQSLAFNQVGVKLSKSTGILLMNFVCTQTAIMMLSLLSLVYFKDLSTHSGHIIWLYFDVFIINFCILFIFFGLGFSKKFRKVIVWIMNKILSWRMFRRFPKAKESFEKYCQDAQETFKIILEHKVIFLICVLSKMAAFAVFYMIPYVVLRALGVDIKPNMLFYVMCMTSFSFIMTSFIPTPGATGGIEFAFKDIFAGIAGVTAPVAAAGVLMWRIITYYALMLISLAIYTLYTQLPHSAMKRYREEMKSKEEEEKALKENTISNDIEQTNDTVLEVNQIEEKVKE